MFDNTTARLRGLMAALMVLSVIVGGAGLVAATDVSSIDTETTATATTSDWTGANVAALNLTDSTPTYVEVVLAGAAEGDVRLDVVDPISNETVLTTSYDTVTNSTANHYAFNITDRELEQLPIGPNATKTFDVKVYDAGNASSAVLKFQQDLSSEGDYARIRIGDYAVDVDDAVDFEEKGIPYLTERTVASGEETVKFASGETNRTVTIEFANTSTADTFENAASDVDTGEWMQFSMATVDDTPIKVFKNEAADDAEGSYAVYDVSAQTLTYHIADDEDASLDLGYVGGNNHAPWDVWNVTNFGFSDLGRLSLPFF